MRTQKIFEKPENKKKLKEAVARMHCGKFSLCRIKMGLRDGSEMQMQTWYEMNGIDLTLFVLCINITKHQSDFFSPSCAQLAPLPRKVYEIRRLGDISRDIVEQFRILFGMPECSTLLRLLPAVRTVRTGWLSCCSSVHPSFCAGRWSAVDEATGEGIVGRSIGILRVSARQAAMLKLIEMMTLGDSVVKCCLT